MPLLTIATKRMLNNLRRPCRQKARRQLRLFLSQCSNKTEMTCAVIVNTGHASAHNGSEPRWQLAFANVVPCLCACMLLCFA